MDERIRAISKRRLMFCIVLSTGLNMSYCKPNKEIALSKFPTQNVCKIEFLNRFDVLFISDDKSKITDFIKMILSAKTDSSGLNYKSFEFIKLYACSGKSYRIAILENHFLAGGEKYIVEADIKKQFAILFNTTLPY